MLLNFPISQGNQPSHTTGTIFLYNIMSPSGGRNTMFYILDSKFTQINAQCPELQCSQTLSLVACVVLVSSFPS